MLGLILFFELTVGIVAVSRSNNLTLFANKAWDSSTNETRISLERQFSCCGFYNTTDRAVVEGCPDGKYESFDIKDTCSHAILNVIKDLTVQIAVTAFIITFFESVTAVITFVLAHRIKLAHQYSAVNQDTFDEYSFSFNDEFADDDDDDDDVDFLKNDPNDLLE